MEFNKSEQKTGTFLLNIVPSKEDSRDFIAESIYPENVTIPKELDLRKFLHPVVNQGSQGTCSAQVAACMKEYQEYKDQGLVGEENKMSPQFIYNLREEPDYEGMSPRETMKILKNTGSCREFVYPYGIIEYPDSISSDAYSDAENYKIMNYAHIETLEGLKTALTKNGVCYICFPVYNETPKMWKKREGDRDMGGHAMSVVGFNEYGFIIRNSWGKEWGEDGYTTYPYSDWGAHWEIWTTIDTNSTLPDFNSADYVRPIGVKTMLAIGTAILLFFNFFSKQKVKP